MTPTRVTTYDRDMETNSNFTPITTTYKRRQLVEWTDHPGGLDASGAVVHVGRIRSYRRSMSHIIIRVNDLDDRWVYVATDEKNLRPITKEHK